MAVFTIGFPPFSTVQKYFYRWRDEGMLRRINNALVTAARELAGSSLALPLAWLIASQDSQFQFKSADPCITKKRDGY